MDVVALTFQCQDRMEIVSANAWMEVLCRDMVRMRWDACHFFGEDSVMPIEQPEGERVGVRV